MNRLFLFLAVGLLLLSSVSIAYADGEVFDGDTVYVNDSRAYISATPHTIQGSGWVENTILSKSFTGNVNWVMLTTEYSQEYFKPTNLQYYDDTLIDVTYYDELNESYIVQEEKGWIDVPKSFIKNNVQVVGKNRAYAITNIPVTAGEPVLFRYYVKQTYYPPMFSSWEPPSDFVGKYDIAVYPSVYGANVKQAYDDGNLYLLDPTVNLTNGLETYWSFDDVDTSGTTLFDEHGSRDITRNGATNSGYTPAIINESYDNIPAGYMSSSRFDTGSNELTISLWAYFDAPVTRSNPLASQRRSSPSANDFQLTNDGSDRTKASFLIWGSNVGTHTSTTGFFDAGEWDHYAFTYNGSNVRFYKNGVLHSVSSTISNTMSNDVNSLFRIGNDHFANYLDGKIDEYGVWSRVLNATEIEALYASGDAFPYPFVNIVDTASITDIDITPSLSVTYFDDYLIEANVTNTSAVNVSVTYTKLSSLPDSPLTYYLNGSGLGEDSITANMSFDVVSLLWEYSAFPDSMYPKIQFAPDALYNENTPSFDTISQGRYHVFNYTNPLTIEDNTSLFLEINADPKASNSVDLEVYLVNNSATASTFLSDWISSDISVLIDSIPQDRLKDHTDTPNSSHYVVELLSNGSLVSGLNISDNFYVVLIARSATARGWDLAYQISQDTNEWFTADSSPSFTALSPVVTGVPDVHLHIVRADSDFVNVSVTASYVGNSSSNSSLFYYSPVGNLAPSGTTFVTPTDSAIVSYPTNYTVSWVPANDPNGDTVFYDVTLFLLGSSIETLVSNTTNTSFVWNIDSSYSDALYELRLTSSDGSLSTTNNVFFSLLESGSATNGSVVVITPPFEFEENTLGFLIAFSIVVGSLVSALVLREPLFITFAGFSIGGVMLYSVNSGLLSHSFVTVLGFAFSVILVFAGLFRILR